LIAPDLPWPCRGAPALAAALLVGLAACEGNGNVGPGNEFSSPAQLEVMGGNQQTGPVASALPEEVVIRVTDQAGQPVPDQVVSFTAHQDGGFEPESRRTDRDGEVQAVWTLGTHAGPATATVSVRGLAPVPLSAKATPGPLDLTRSALSAQPAAVPTGGTSILTVTAEDAFGNRLPGLAVHLTTTGANSNLNQSGPTGPDGIATGTFDASVAGTDTITAEVAGVWLVQRATIVVEGSPRPGSVSVSPSTIAVLAGQTVQLTAAVLDQHGTPIEGAPVKWSSSDTRVTAVDSGGLLIAGRPGTATITATLGEASGSAKVTISFGEGAQLGLTYCTIDGIADKMDVYLPSASQPRPLPVAVHLHGGGWVSGSRSTGQQFAAMKDTLLDRGYLVVSLDYRLAPAHRYPSQIQDVKCAIRHLRSRASRYGLDPDRIGVWGGSAGGQLAALLGTADETAGFDEVGGFSRVSSRIQAVVAISAITDFTHPEELHDDYSREFLTWPDPGSAEMIKASPIVHVSTDDPPFFFIVGQDDPLVSIAQSVRMSQRLQSSGITSSVLTVLHAGHDLEPTTGPTDPGWPVIVARIAGFFDRELP
jgi:acetyl esterase/lipase